MQDYRKLNVWEKSHSFTLEIYSITKSFPAEEKFGVISQIRRSAASIPTNIAEGTGRGSNKEFNRFLQISMGSASETEYLLILSMDLEYVDNNIFNKLLKDIQEIKKMLTGLMKKL